MTVVNDFPYGDAREYLCIGFDLDDTLHFFKRASSAASQIAVSSVAVLANLPFEQLNDLYKIELLKVQKQNFTANRPSKEYRAERFKPLLSAAGLNEDDHLEWILDIYKNALAENISIKPGVLELLSTVKGLGLKTVVISEGPMDAQEWTIKQLGIDHLVDQIITSSSVGISKTDGLFESALSLLKIKPSDMFYIGDSYERDYVPANEIGIPSLVVGEIESVDAPFVTSLNTVNDWFSV